MLLNNYIFYIFFSGLLSLTTQIIFLRQFFYIFSGSEYILFFFWFFWFSFNLTGYIIAKKFFDKIKFHIKNIIIIYLFVIVISYFILKFSFIFFVIGNIFPFNFYAFLFAIISLFFPCFFNGLLLNLIYNLLSANENILAKIYLFEAAGFLIAGIFTNFFTHFLTDYQIIIFFISLTFLFVIFIFQKKYLSFIFFILALFLFLFSEKFINKFIFNKIYPSFEFIKEYNTPTGKLEILKSKNYFTLLYSGEPFIFEEAPGIDEEIIYTAYAQTIKEPSILIYGDFAFSFLKKFSNLPYKKIVIVLPDKILFDYYKSYLDLKTFKILKKPNIEVKFSTLQNYLQKEKNKFDIIFISGNKPYLLKNTIYYFPQFLSILKNSLNENGVVEFIFDGIENYLSNEYIYLYGSIFSSFKKVFKFVEIFPFNKLIFLVSNNKINDNFSYFQNTLNERNINAEFFNPANIELKLLNKKNFGINKIIEFNSANTFNEPMTIIYGLSTLISEYNLSLSKKITDFVLFIKDKKINFLILFFLLFFVLLSLYFKFSFFNSSIFFFSFSASFFEIILLYLFQLNYGNLFLIYGFLVSVFMAGLIIALFSEKYIFSFRKKFFLLFILNSFIISLIFVLLFYSQYLLLFFIAVFIAGFLQGFAFKSISDYYSLNFKKSNFILYINDFFGSIFVFIFAPLFIIPFTGFIYPLFFIFIFSIYILLFKKLYD